ncbi:MAG: hypothetical protein IPG46_16520 [Actinobacteria bacterium]|nr:hypothetical protein [Actinomycetota bacterium]
MVEHGGDVGVREEVPQGGVGDVEIGFGVGVGAGEEVVFGGFGVEVFEVDVEVEADASGLFRSGAVEDEFH